MARREITTPLDLDNMNRHNANFEELYNQISETTKRITQELWDEMQEYNTIRMKEPVQTLADLPESEENNTLRMVLDEQKVYAYSIDEWTEFQYIDLDPYTPFKEELSEIVAAYEDKIQNITQEVQSTKDSAIKSIESTQSQSESDIQAIRDEMTTQTSDLTALFNDSMDNLTSKQDTALAEVDSAKQAAITALENFQNTDTSNWQKYKLTNDDGAHVSTGLNSDYDALHALEPGFHYTTSTPIDLPVSSTAGFTEVSTRSDLDNIKHIRFRPYNSNQEFIKIYYNEWRDWEPAGGTKVELYKGSASGVDATLSLSAPYDLFEYLIVSFNSDSGRQTKIFEAQDSGGIAIGITNVYNDASGAKAHEMTISRTDLTTLTITNEASYTFDGSSSDDSTVVIEKIVGVK